MSTPSRSISRSAILQVLLVLVVLVVVTSAVTSSSAVCASCHAMQPYAKAQAGGRHSSVSCYACHLRGGLWGLPGQKAAEFFVMYPAALLGSGVRGPSAQVAPSSCLGCHDDVLARVSRKGRVRIDHATCAQGRTCDYCHAATPHGSAVRWSSAVDMADCVACHRSSNAPAGCDTCHNAQSTAKRLSTGVWAKTHGAAWRKTHGMGDVRYCDACHPSDYCVRCHGTRLPHPSSFLASHGGEARMKSARCLTCHAKAFCDGCHGTAMPHPATFRRDHMKAAKRADDPACLKCHRASDCKDCHVAHTHPGKTNGTLGGTALPNAAGAKPR